MTMITISQMMIKYHDITMGRKEKFSFMIMKFDMHMGDPRQQQQQQKWNIPSQHIATFPKKLDKSIPNIE